MADHSPTPQTDSIAALEARLAEIEAGILDPFAFTSKTLIQASFPHSARAGKAIELTNGGMRVSMLSAAGLPYGVYPRLLMMWLTREALRRKHLPIEQARVIPLGSSVTQFMRDVGIRAASGGESGTITRLRDQMRRLFSTMISVELTGVEDREDMPRTFRQIDNTLIADSAVLWWDPQVPDAEVGGSVVTLSEGFFRDLVGSAVPLDVAILRSVRSSPMALDLYGWLTYRLSYLRAPTVVTWDQLRQQLGASYPATSQGRRDVKKKIIGGLSRVLDAWPEAEKSVSLVDYGVLLRRGEPSVPKAVQKALEDRIDQAPF